LQHSDEFSLGLTGKITVIHLFICLLGRVFDGCSKVA